MGDNLDEIKIVISMRSKNQVTDFLVSSVGRSAHPEW